MGTTIIDILGSAGFQTTFALCLGALLTVLFNLWSQRVLMGEQQKLLEAAAKRDRQREQDETEKKVQAHKELIRQSIANAQPLIQESRWGTGICIRLNNETPNFVTIRKVSIQTNRGIFIIPCIGNEFTIEHAAVELREDHSVGMPPFTKADWLWSEKTLIPLVSKMLVDVHGLAVEVLYADLDGNAVFEYVAGTPRVTRNINAYLIAMGGQPSD